MSQGFNLEKIYQYLLISLGFLMPITIFGANMIIAVIVFLWIVSGDYRSKINTILDSKLMILSVIFFFIHLIGLLWTEDLIWGLEITRKMWYFLLLFPILFTIVNKSYTKYYVYAFLIAIALTEILSYLVWYEVIGEFKNASVRNPTPFMSHISYNPIITLAIYIVSHEVLFNKSLGKLTKYFFIFFVIAMIFNMFITGGRAGQVMFFAMIGILIFQFYRGQKLKAILIISVLIPGIFLAAYNSSTIFNKRVNEGFNEIVSYNKSEISAVNVSSIGERVLFALNCWEIIKKNPILGVGTGDLPNEYKKVNQKNTPSAPNVTNPHNMYTLILVQLGFLGLASMLSVIFYQIRLSFLEKNQFYRNMGITLPLLFLLIMFSDSYLLGHYTTLLYIYFSSFIYKGFD
jgi:O-antigen ligase